MEEVLLYLQKSILALLIGGLVGYEREMGNKPAGLRTHMLVTLAATLFISLVGSEVDYMRESSPDTNWIPDPIRIFQSIVIGVSFIGAGTIVKSKETGEVANLTTAASILVTAALGVAIGIEKYWIAIVTAVLLVVVNYGLAKFEKQVLQTK